MKQLINIRSIFAFTMLMGFMIACNDQADTKEAAADSSYSKTQAVEVVNPQKRSFTAEVLIAGNAQANQMVMLYAMESGLLTDIRVDIGDKVSKGETIAILNNPELLQEKMKLEAEYRLKEVLYERLDSVYRKSPALTTLTDVEIAKSEYLSAKASLNAINDRVSFLMVRAPFSGTVTKRFVDNGSLIQNGLKDSDPQAIVEIQETDLIRLIIPVPESDAVSVKKGMDVQVTFPELSNEVFMAKISRTSAALDPLSKTMQVEIDLDNSAGKIITGMYAKVLIQLASRSSILSLPILSKVRYKNEDYVLLVEDQIVKRVLVRIGLSDEDYFEVLNKEISEESQVILIGKGLVNPGQLVNPILKSE